LFSAENLKLKICFFKVKKNFLFITILILLFLISSGCRQYSDYVEVSVRTLNTAQRQDIELKIKIIKGVVDNFYADNLRKPESIDELIQTGYLSSPPKDSFGNGFRYDPETDTVISITYEEIEKQKKEAENKRQN